MSIDEDKKEVEKEKVQADEVNADKSSKEKAEEIPEDVELPPPSFSSLVMMLSATALGYLAELEKADPKKKKILLQLARHTIDSIQVLDDKTKGNLEKNEKELIDGILADLRLQFIKFTG
ncbi:MAG: DUF1844 domain-containing protein [Candidatus Glassbacteria bacterium]